MVYWFIDIDVLRGKIVRSSENKKYLIINIGLDNDCSVIIYLNLDGGKTICI